MPVKPTISANHFARLFCRALTVRLQLRRDCRRFDPQHGCPALVAEHIDGGLVAVGDGAIVDHENRIRRGGEELPEPVFVQRLK